MVYFGQTVGWIKMPLGTGVGLAYRRHYFALARSPISATAELLFLEETSLILLKINNPHSISRRRRHEI